LPKPCDAFLVRWLQNVVALISIWWWCGHFAQINLYLNQSFMTLRLSKGIILLMAYYQDSVSSNANTKDVLQNKCKENGNLSLAQDLSWRDHQRKQKSEGSMWSNSLSIWLRTGRLGFNPRSGKIFDPWICLNKSFSVDDYLSQDGLLHRNLIKN